MGPIVRQRHIVKYMRKNLNELNIVNNIKVTGETLRTTLSGRYTWQRVTKDTTKTRYIHSLIEA